MKILNKSGKKIDSGYVSMLMAIMDYESRKPGCRDYYPQTMAFIQGKAVNVDGSIYNHLGAKFLDENGNLKREVAKKYKIKTWEEMEKKAA